MSRSSYKLPFVHRSLWARSIERDRWVHPKLREWVRPKKEKEDAPYIDPRFFFWARSSLIPRHFANSGYKICVFNGRVFQIFFIQSKYVGQRFGQYFYTRRPARHRGKQRQVKKVHREKKKANRKTWV